MVCNPKKAVNRGSRSLVAVIASESKKSQAEKDGRKEWKAALAVKAKNCEHPLLGPPDIAVSNFSCKGTGSTNFSLQLSLSHCL